MSEEKNSLIQLYDMLDIIENTNKTNDKLAILSSYKGNTFLKTIFNIALNPYIKTQISDANLNQIFEYIKTMQISDETFSKEILAVCETPEQIIDKIAKYLSERKVTGNNMISFMATAFFYFSCIEEVLVEDIKNSRTAKWLSRIFTKKLRIGISEANLCKALNMSFRSVVVESASDTYKLSQNCDKLFKNIDNWIIEEKFDGIRFIVCIDENGNVSYITRSGRVKDTTDFPKITSYLQLQEKLRGKVLDCEITGSNWNQTVNVIQRKNIIKDQDLKLNVFDMLTIDELINQNCERTLEQRKKLLIESIIPKEGIVEIVNFESATSIENIWSKFNEIVKRGGEGLILKDLTSVYEFKRTKSWLKLKQIISDEFKCIGINEGTGKNKGRLGAIIIMLQEKPLITCKCSGFTEQQSIYYWQHPNEIINHIVEIEYRTKTTNKDGTFSLRHPTFIRIRLDKEE